MEATLKHFIQQWCNGAEKMPFDYSHKFIFGFNCFQSQVYKIKYLSLQPPFTNVHKELGCSLNWNAML